MLAAAAAFVVVVALSLVIFLESGSNAGRVTLNVLEAYPPGTVTRFPEEGFYVVRLPDGAVLALSDLDRANRVATGRRCKVAPIAAADPAYRPTLDRYVASFSREATGATLIFREECHGAIYDAAGMRLDSTGPNLDRLGTMLDEAGRLVVLTARRECSLRDDEVGRRVVDCP
jgi:hypothetical protein